MSNNYFRFVLLTTFLIQLTWFISCSDSPSRSRKGTNEKSAAESVSPSPVLIKMVSPDQDAEYKLKQPVKVVIAEEKGDKPIDSLRIYFDGKPAGFMKSAPWEYSIPSPMTGMTGRKAIRVVAYGKDLTQTITRFVIVYSDIVPEVYHFRIKHTYPHDPEAFTQGLFYDEGKLYEGTGQEAGSTLREVDLETGKVLRQHNLESSLFGEGITLYKSRIYQVTWTSKVGFVYDRATFDVINRIYYQTQGWGLATVDDRIAMSDGTNVIYFFEPGMFTVSSRLEVYDNEKQVDQLNELEFINGEIWANIWQTDRIARIDPASGRVNSYVDLSSLWPDAQRKGTNADVLNGIAYDAQGKRIFVTGKRWPKLYEIEITK
jgi:glutaminyl-peptide cyclotransferase